MNQGWISVNDRLPEEHESMFAKLKGTENWRNAMFCKFSNEVIVACTSRNMHKVTTSHIVDGKWLCEESMSPAWKVIAWMPLPEYDFNLEMKNE